jgi:hypothetical protein
LLFWFNNLPFKVILTILSLGNEGVSISEFLELVVDKKNNLFLFISLSEGEPKAADKLILFVLESHQVYRVVSKMICNITYTFINQRLS